MFTWAHEDSIEVDLSLQKAWDFYMNPTNWLKWEDRFDAVVFGGSLTTGSLVKAKIKNKPVHIEIRITEVKPYHECKYLVKVLFFTQESICTFEELSSERTRIILKLKIYSLFTPFMKKLFLKNLEKYRSKCLDAFAKIAKEV